ncbi:MAG: restriction endonuclease subunit S [Euryarchaeota archaeon]|nr:restriction endonuclease subunit S [Euryarchaeota archaeon]
MKQEIRERIEKIRKGEVPEGYRKTKVGIVVKEWDLIEFRTVFEEVSELTSDIQKYPLNSLTIQTGVEAKTQRYERSFLITKEGDNYKIVSKDQFVFNPMNIRFGAIGRYKGETKVCVSGYYNVFRCINGNNSAYMEYLLKDYRMIQLYNKYSLGSLIEKQRLHYSHFIKFKISLPQLKEQQKIAEILSTWDKAIELIEKLISEKKDFKKGLMQQLLTGKVRFPEFTDDWKEYQLKDICKFMKGSGLSKEKLSINGKRKCILYGELYTAYSEVIQEVISKTNIAEGVPSQKGDVLIPASTTSSGIDLANATAIEENSVLLGGDINILRNDKSLFNSSFLAHYLTHIKKFDIASKAQGITIIHLYGEHLKKIQVNIPQVKEQEKVAQVLSIQNDLIEKMTDKLLQLKQQKKGLMQLLLTGIVRVKVD